MKSSTILAIGVSVISLAFAISITSSKEGLVLAWSNYGVFNGVNLQEVADVDCNQISRAVSNKDSGLNKYLGSSKAIPEILVVFVQPNLGAREFPVLAQAYSTLPNGGAFQKLKEYLETSSSSLSLTNAHDSRNQMSDNFPQYLKRDFNIDNVVYAGHEQSLTIEQLLEKLNGNWNLLNNGKTDLIVVKFNSPALAKLSDAADVSQSYARDDASMGNIISAIQAKEVDYIAFFVGEESRVQSSGRIEEEQMRIFKDSFAQTGGYTTNWTQEINEGLLVILPVFIIIGIAIRCAFSLQSSLPFDAGTKILKGIRH